MPTAPEADVSFWAANGTQLPSPVGAFRRVEVRKLPDGSQETLTYRLELPTWMERRTRRPPENSEPGNHTRTRYWPWGAERLRVAVRCGENEQQVDVHAYFPTGELRRHHRYVGTQRTTLFIFAELTGEDYTYTEEMPQYPGGMEQLMRDLGQHVKYPPIALRNQLQGKVPVKFELNSDGRMGNFTAAPEAEPMLAEAALAALRHIATFRRWRPGFQNRRAVKVNYTVPVTFTIR